MKKLYIKINELNQAMLYPPILENESTLEEYCKNNFKDGDYCITDFHHNMMSSFPEAFKIIEGQIVIDYETAKELQREKWRRARKPLLEKLDIDFMRSLENGDIISQKIIVEKKQELRDVTKTPMIDDFDTILLTWPNILKGL